MFFTMAFWRSCQVLVLLVISHFAHAQRRHEQIGPFSEKLYAGTRGQGIATIYYRTRIDSAWVNQPTLCHGVFVDLRKVVTTCSCVAYPTRLETRATPWYHPYEDWAVTKYTPQRLFVGVLADEYLKYANNKLINKVDVEKVELSKDCSVNFRHNMAILTLKKSPKGIKLSWVYSADWLVMKWATQKAAIGSAGGGRCEVMRWANHGKPMKVGSREELGRARFHDRNLRFDANGDMRSLASQAVYLLPWHECLEQVCPRYAPEGYKKPLQFDRRECFNEYNVTRFCVSWHQMDSLCLLPEGTPVFCDIGDLRGVFGLLSNVTLWCEKSFNFKNVMIGIDTIMNGLYNILRVRNGPGYDNGWPEYLDVLRTPDDYKLQ